MESLQTAFIDRLAALRADGENGIVMENDDAVSTLSSLILEARSIRRTLMGKAWQAKATDPRQSLYRTLASIGKRAGASYAGINENRLLFHTATTPSDQNRMSIEIDRLIRDSPSAELHRFVEENPQLVVSFTS